MRPRARTPLMVRFFRHVVFPDADFRDCWLWGASKFRTGYGAIGRGGRGEGVTTAHRVSYEIFKGPIPDGLHIDHTCNNRPCVNPLHLDAVTQAENNRRMAKRGRDVGPAQSTRDEIGRRRLSGERVKDLASEYGVDRATVWKYAKAFKANNKEASANADQ